MHSTFDPTSGHAALLGQVPLFAGLGADELRRVVEICELVSFAPGDTIFEVGDAADALYVIIEGRVDVTLDGTVVNQLSRGDILGEVAMIGAFERTAAAVAAMPVSCLELRAESFHAILAESASLGHSTVRFLSERLRFATEREVARTAELNRAYRELRDTQTRLLEAGRLASLGTLVAGVSHEINTPLAAALSSLDTLTRALSKLKQKELGAQPAFQVLESAQATLEAGLRRVSEVAERLRSFARLDQAEVQRVDLRECIRDALEQARQALPEGATVHVDLPSRLELTCRPARLNQAFFNLLLNAAQAISVGGNVRVSAEQNAGEIRVAIADDGAGISEKHLGNVFEPGFTTKGAGLGTGLGLSICRQVIEDHGGRIEVRSEPGQGTTFTVGVPSNRVKSSGVQ